MLKFVLIGSILLFSFRLINQPKPIKKPLPKEYQIIQNYIKSNQFRIAYQLLSENFKLQPNDTSLLRMHKQLVINDYLNSYLPHVENDYQTYFLKQPLKEKCMSGEVNTKGHHDVKELIQYCRRISGIYDSIVFDETLNKKCQAAAFVMFVNNKLNHSPPKSWRCNNADAIDGANNSNLSLGHAFGDALIGQIEDDGANNTECGHRRWILNPRNQVFGHGSTSNSMALNVLNSQIKFAEKFAKHQDSVPICWPSKNYFPIDLIFERWSFSLANADFTDAQVVIKNQGKNINCIKEPVAKGYGLNTLVWKVKDQINTENTYEVIVFNVKVFGGNQWVKKSFKYRVMPIKINNLD
ncbi:MAG: CAP domain-containing protein [Bacteroidota bacterium]|nr:CAP domain-containing protein [Bacteroidota bacterium]